jgi:hypothetical protein
MKRVFLGFFLLLAACGAGTHGKCDPRACTASQFWDPLLCECACVNTGNCMTGSWNRVLCACTTSSGAEGDSCGGFAPGPTASCATGLGCQGDSRLDFPGTCTKPCTSDGDCSCPAKCDLRSGVCSGEILPCPEGETYSASACACVGG